ncbi:hypothetical protein [Acinetobacter lwoffii]|uniref:hypothetical protein n=1 Tax=Acinetobacter lwoffii TaxID=28090 RepID=UPI00209ADBCB|nr:hypothetical protein [Acinetobacter lwoffii]MCO8114634.1 hypothetical protein [Acinetobacter lwoffii]
MLEIKSKKDQGDKRKAQQLESIKDIGPTVRSSLVLSEDRHRRYKIYLAQNRLNMKDHLTSLIDECIKDIP